MYYVKKRLEVSAAHRLKLSYPSKCTNLHGHNWIVTVECKARELNADGMVTDFSIIKDKINSLLDHAVLNEVLPLIRLPRTSQNGLSTMWIMPGVVRFRKATGTWQYMKKIRLRQLCGFRNEIPGG